MSDDFDDDEDSRGISRLTGREKKRARGKPFIAGESGNPLGRPKVTNMPDVRAKAREYTDLALETLVEIMGNSEEKGAARVAAANSVLDRGWGKAPQNVVIEEGTKVERLNDADLADAVRAEIAKFIGIDFTRTDETEDSTIIN